MKNTDTVPNTKEDNRHSDLLLIDLLDLDMKRFFVRYKTDIVGFAVSLAITLSMIGLAAMMAQIGS